MTKKCIGCGSILQNTDLNKLGYTENLENEFCRRCFRLKNYGEYQNVSLNNEDYQRILDSIPTTSLVVYITSLLNINLDYINKFKNVLIVLTKRDLLPKSIKDHKLVDYIKNHYNNYLNIEVVSAIKNYNLDNLISKIKKYGKNKEIYFIGMTNSGKSTLINSLIKNYTEKNLEITTSMYPSTTLNKINIKLDDLTVVDTPGVLSENSIINSLSLSDIKKITPKKEIKPRSYQLKDHSSLLIEDIIKIDNSIADNITIYLANNLKITKLYEKDKQFKEVYQFHLPENTDIVIEDLCFIKFQKELDVTISSPYKLNIYTRDNLI